MTERRDDARVDADAASVPRGDAFGLAQEEARDPRLRSATLHGAIAFETASVSSTSLFSKTASTSYSRSVSSRIPRFTLGTSEPPSPQPSFASMDAPSSIASTAESVSSRTYSRAIDSGTPSRLAQFRTKNWVRDAGRKRVLEMTDGQAAAQPPKRRAVTSLFSDVPRRVPVTVGEGDDDDDGDDDDSDKAVVDGTSEEQQDRFSDTTSMVSYGARSTSQSSSTTDSYEDTQLRFQQEIKVGRCLEQDLTRDNARMKLKMDSLRDDIDYYYELLAKIEAVAVNARGQAVFALKDTGGTTTSDGNASIVGLAEAVQRIISAPKPDRKGVDEVPN